MGVSSARISQIFSSKCNVTIRSLAEVFFALGEECSVCHEESRLVLSTAPKRHWEVRQMRHNTSQTAVAQVYAIRRTRSGPGMGPADWHMSYKLPEPY